MLFMRNFTYTECYPYIILPRRNVSYRKSVQYENELYDVTLRNVTIRNVTDPLKSIVLLLFYFPKILIRTKVKCKRYKFLPLKKGNLSVKSNDKGKNIRIF